MKNLWNLFWLFAKIGISTFGGGYAMLPLFMKELQEKKGYITEEEMIDYYAISQCTPGMIAVNTATFVGNKLYKSPGAIVASAGVIFPSLIIILTAAILLQNVAHIPAIQHAFSGIRIVVVVLILSTIVDLWKSSMVDAFSYILIAMVLIISLFSSVPPALIVISSGILGILRYYFFERFRVRKGLKESPDSETSRKREER